MNNAQLSLLIESYCDLLCAAVDSVQAELPDELRVTETVKPFIGYSYEQTTYPCLAPLDELIARMKEHIQVLRETGTDDGQSRSI